MCRYDFQVDSETLRLPTLKELVGYSTAVTESIAELTSTFPPSTTAFVNITIGNNALKKEQVYSTDSKNQLQDLLQDVFEENISADDNDDREFESLRGKEIIDNDVLGSDEVLQHSFSSSFPAAATETQHMKSTQGNGVNDSQPIERVEVPVKLLDDANGEEIAELVLLRLPETKLSSILKPVFRVKILKSDEEGERKHVRRNGIGPDSTSAEPESSSENELFDNQRPSSRRRLRTNFAQASLTFAAPANQSLDRAGERSRPRYRQRIIKARRRVHITESPLDRSDEELLQIRQNERPTRVQEDGRISRRRDYVDNNLESVTSTPVYPAKTSTVAIATTSRGNLPTLKSSNGTRGFYITRSSDEIFTPIPDAIITDFPIDSTKNLLITSNNAIDEQTQRTDFAMQKHESSVPYVEIISPTTEESWTYESVGTNLREIGITTEEANEIDSLGDLLKSTSDKHETVTPDNLSTIENRLAESFTAIIMATTEVPEDAKVEEAVEEPLITTFRPFTTTETVSDSTIPMNSTTPEYSTAGQTERNELYTETNVDVSRGDVAETLTTSENSHYISLPTLQVQSTTMPTSISLEEHSSTTAITETTHTKIPASKWTNFNDKATIRTDGTKRGKVRFTATSKSGVSAEMSFNDHSRKVTESSESNDFKINSGSEIESGERNPTSTKIDNKKVEPTSTTVEESGTRAFVARSSTKSRNRQRSTTKSPETYDSGIDLAAPKELNLRRGVKINTSTTKDNLLSSSLVETTDTSYTARLSSRQFERSEKTTKSFEVDEDNINSVTHTPTEFPSRSGNSTELYNETVDPTKITTRIDNLNTNFVKPTGISYTSKSTSLNPEQLQETANFFEEDDTRINSVTSAEFTSINDISTEVYDKTLEPTIAITEPIDISTNFVGIAGSSYASRLPSVTHDHPRTTTPSIETDISITLTPSGDISTESYDKNVENTITTTNAKKTTESNLSTTRHNDESRTTIKTTNINDYTVASTTPKELIATITTEPYDTTIHQTSITAEDHQNPNFIKMTGSSFFTTFVSEGINTTTESYDKTGSLKPLSTVDFVTAQEEVNPTDSTNRAETTVASAVTTKPWAYKQQSNDLRTSEPRNTETTNIFNDITATETFAPTTEIYLKNDRTIPTMRTGTADAEDNEKQIFTKAIQEMKEGPTTVEMKNYDSTEVSKQSYTTMPPGNAIIDKLEESTVTPVVSVGNIESTTISATANTYSSKINHNFDVRRTTFENPDKNTYSTTQPSYNFVSPITRGDPKYTRGRVRFTNRAGNTDDDGRHKKPVKQVVVRRRLVNPSKNRQPINDSITKKTSSNQRKTGEEENADKLTGEKLAEEKRNSTKSMRRRVVVYRGRPRAENVTPMTMQSSSVASNDVSENIGRTRRRKWRKRLVVKRARTDDPDDQSIAETGHFHQTVIDNSADEDLRAVGSHMTEPMDRELVNSAERKDEDIGDGEVNIFKSSGGFLRRPGTLIRPEGFNRIRSSLPTTQASGQSVPFSKIRPVDTTEDIKSDDQSGRAQELAVTLADPPEIRATTSTGRVPFRTSTRKISTTIAPRTEAPVTSRTTPVSRRRQRPRGNSNNDKIVESVSTRPRRPAIIDYDYYVDDEVRLVLKPELKDKLFVTRKGGIRCLDQGNFAHPTSCKKFITCARMVNGQVLGTEYTCPEKLSFDPVGGICNWSAGLGCEEKPTP